MADEDSSESLQIAGFWRRLLAFVIDILVLKLVGICLGLFFSDYFIAIGPWGFTIGLCIALVYFTVMESSIGGGKSIGKTFLKLNVVSRNGEYLGLTKSLVRSSFFCIPYFWSAATGLHSFTGYPFLILTAIGTANVYLYLFNRKTRQILPDLIVQSLVVKAPKNREADFLKLSPFTKRVWRGHYAILVIVAIFSISGTSIILRKETFSSMLSLAKALSKQPDVISVLTVTTESSATMRDIDEKKLEESLSVTVWTNNKNFGPESANRLRETILSNYPGSSRLKIVNVEILYGYDIGIDKEWLRANFSFSPQSSQPVIPKAGILSN